LFDFIQEIAATGAMNSLSQSLLRMTTPGIPDLYQGTELWDFSLVDPDNRRPVDYMIRQELLHDDDYLAKHPVAQKRGQWKNGAIKQHIIKQTLTLRREHLSLFTEGSYVPLEVTGPRAAHIVAFLRSYGHETAVVIAPRLTHCFTERQLFAERKTELTFADDCWKGTVVHLPEMINSDLHDVLSGQGCHVYSGKIELARVLTQLPLALLFKGGNPIGE
jgi:(1->4)-alpha-D-glucan 1-alpha-D-glucosylmutase